MVPGAVVLRRLNRPGKGGPDWPSEEVIADLRGSPERLPFRPPVPVRGTGEGPGRCVREVHPTCPLAAPQVTARLRGLLTGHAGGRPVASSRAPRKGGDRLTVTVSVVFALGVVVFLLCRYAGLKVWHAAICIVLGFYLASSALAPEMGRATHSLFHML
jgi:hypothetical protein